jgi:hypothetical protein
MRILGFVVASIAAGMAAGFALGSRTGVKTALEAGRSIDAETLGKALAWKPEIAAGAPERREIAQLLDELRTARAQMEAYRHDRETMRAAERLRALETAREAGDRSAAARAEKIEMRLDRLERMSIDPLRADPSRIDLTPTGALPKAERRDPARTASEPSKLRGRSIHD